MNLHPETLRQIGFRDCEHPLVEVTPISMGRSLVVKYCLTCGATLNTGPEWRRGVFHTDHGINYERLNLHGLMSNFEFWIKQRPDSRAFGDI